jgi:branched-chain amino acid transport system ATP-binding protein
MLSLDKVVKQFGGLRAVDGVSMTVPEGKIVGLIGPNGSGKSTLINVVAGQVRANAGSITFDGHNITRSSPDTIFQRGLVRGYQDPALFFQMTVLDNALLPVKQQRGERPWYAPWRRTWKDQENNAATRAAIALESVQLRGHYDRLASDLSGGQMKLAEIARCLLGEPKMMLLDEPTAGVAPKLAYQIFEQIAALRRERGITFLIVEHRLEILFDFVDWIYVMHMGQVLAQGTPTEITANSAVREVYFGD